MAAIRLWLEPTSRLRLFAWNHASGGVGAAEGPYALDHLAAVVHDLDGAARAIASHIGGTIWHRDWYFPEFGTTNLCVQTRESTSNSTGLRIREDCSARSWRKADRASRSYACARTISERACQS